MDRRTAKIKLFKKLTKGRRACQTCISRSKRKNMFSALRKGTC